MIEADEELRVFRNFVIEECARRAEEWGCDQAQVAAIRDLKDKP